MSGLLKSETLPMLEKLELALLNQVIEEVETYIDSIDHFGRIEAARAVMKYILPVGSHESQVQLNVDFMERLIALMVGFINSLVDERVSTLALSSQADRVSLSKHSIAVMGSGIPLVISELRECDRFLRALRSLQSDMAQLSEINEGIIVCDELLTRSHSVVNVSYPGNSSIEHVVERSLVVGNPCAGIHWLSGRKRLQGPPGESMRSISRLIAYLFFTASSMDSFFVGIHILRNSGQHVQKVLESIYENTSIRFVRDRIARHLSHRGFKENALMARIESLYSNNCYTTELNRKWTDCLSLGNTSPQGQEKLTTPAQPVRTAGVDCANIPDIAVSHEIEKSGLIGSVSVEEASTVLKCQDCSSGGQDLSVTARPSGYLFVYPGWIGKMTDEEIRRILIEADALAPEWTPSELLSFYVSHKNWEEVQRILNTSSDRPGTVFKPSGAFLDRLIREATMATQTPGNVSRSDAACIGRLLTGDASVSPSTDFHRAMVHWLMIENNLPQVLLLYLRRYGLGTSSESVRDLGIDGSMEFDVIAHGRLGNDLLPHIATLLDGPLDALSMMSLWMIDGKTPEGESKELIVSEYGILEGLANDLTPPDIIPEISDDLMGLSTFKEDVSLSTLLNDVYPDLDLDALPNASSSLADNSSVSPLFEAEYLLAQGRPSMAYNALVGNEWTSSQLQASVRRVAFYNLFDDGIVASAVSLLDLFGESTEKLRVDIQSARTILSNDVSPSTCVIEIFLGFESSSSGNNNLLSALKLLEESAWAKEPPVAADALAAASQVGTGSSGFESPWHLVALFCRVHNLPRSLTLLHELARNGDWVMFLHESDLQQCPIDTVRDVIGLYFRDSPLRSHLNILISSGDKSEESEAASPKRPSRCPGLERVLDGSPQKWLESQTTSSDCLVTKERMNALFSDSLDHSVMFKKAVYLRRFDDAQDAFSKCSESAQKVSVHSELLREEINRIMDPSALMPDKSPRKGIFDMEVDYEDLPLQDQDLSQDELRSAIVDKEFDSIRSSVNSPEGIQTLCDVIIETFKSRLSEAEYQLLVAVVTTPWIEAFGDQMAARAVQVPNSPLKEHLELVTYHSYCCAFVSEKKLLEFIESSEYLSDINTFQDSLSQVVASEPRLALVNQKILADSQALALIADEILKRTVANASSDLAQSLGVIVSVSETYRDIGLLGKHVATNNLAADVVSQIRALECA